MATVGAASVPKRSGRDGVTAALAAWLMIGLFVDGFMHNTRGGELESFFTPWHGLLYSGFVVSAVWITLPMWNERGSIRRRLETLPDGYAAGAVGVLIFAAGGIADSIWHSALGIEVDIDALLSPPHLVLFLGAMLIVSTPARAAWRRSSRAPTLRGFLPALASITLSTLLVGFFFMYASGLFDFHATIRFADVFASGGELAESPFLYDILNGSGVTARMLTTLIVMAPVVLLTARWKPPAGTFTIFFTSYTAFMLVLVDFQLPLMVLAGLTTGVAADVAARQLEPSPDRPERFRVFAAAVPILLWSLHFGVLALVGDLGWPIQLWGGVVLFAGGLGYMLGSLMTLPRSVDLATTVSTSTSA